MINNFLDVSQYAFLGFLGVAFAYLMTSLLLAVGMNKLPRDHGREFAHDGGLSAGKPVRALSLSLCSCCRCSSSEVWTGRSRSI